MQMKLLTSVIVLLTAACSPRDMIVRKLTNDAGAYFQGDPGQALTHVGGPVYTFHSGWERTIVVKTTEGLVVADPMSPKFASQLQAALDQEFPGMSVRLLFYTHYHLDHASGGAALNAQEIVAHERCPQYWADLATAAVAKPTRYIAGDQHWEIGGVKMELLDVGKSHTDTLYAVYFPTEKILFAADLGLVKTFPPLGWPDIYTPGFIHAMERLATLEFTTFVPSHFQTGTKADFIEHLEFMRFVRAHARKVLDKHGFEPNSPETMAAVRNEIYKPLQEKYGAWHGFNQFGLFTVMRHLTGEGLGY